MPSGDPKPRLECSAVLNRSPRRTRVKRDRLAFKSLSGIRAELHRVDEAHGSSFGLNDLEVFVNIARDTKEWTSAHALKR